MARLASRREIRRDMVRIRGLLEIRQVAARAGRRGSRELSADMARRAVRIDVLPRQAESSVRVVIEIRGRPPGRRVTRLAARREPGGRMVGSGRPLEIRKMAPAAVHSDSRVPRSHVARRTCRSRVFPRQGEPGLRVVECRRLPGQRGCVASLAGCREARRRVIGIGRLPEIRQMAARAIGGRPGELVVHVTLRAGGRGVLAGEREFRSRIVIERSAVPLARAVARSAVLRESAGRVIRVHCPLVVREVAGVATGGQGREPVVDVALRARGPRMGAGQRKRGLRVIELAVGPCRGGVARGAVQREPRRNVVRILHRLKRRLMA